MMDKLKQESLKRHAEADQRHEPHNVSASGSNELLCGCNGCPVKGAVCGYIAVGGKLCRAPADYDCYYKSVDRINKVVSNIDNILNDSSDPEFQKEIKEIFNT